MNAKLFALPVLLGLSAIFGAYQQPVEAASRNESTPVTFADDKGEGSQYLAIRNDVDDRDNDRDNDRDDKDND